MDLFNIEWVTKFIYIYLSSVMEFKELMKIAIECKKYHITIKGLYREIIYNYEYLLAGR